MTDNAQRKTFLRRAARETRARFVSRLSLDEKGRFFAAVPAELRALLARSSASVASYAAFGDEPDPAAFDAYVIERGGTLAKPWFAGRDAPMHFRVWQPDLPCLPGPYGIAQPQPDALLCTPDLILCPLLGFDRSGNRLGQGGGHYDRFFAAFPNAVRIGMGWSVQQIDALPIDAHDQRLHAIWTEQEWIETA